MTIFDPTFHNRISKWFVERLKNLPNENRFKEVQAGLKALPYQAIVQLAYMEEYDERLKLVAVRRPTITAVVMEQDKKIVAPLIYSLEGEGSLGLDIKIIELLPEEAECWDCLQKIRRPYHYFPTSKVYRCVACAETEDFTSFEQILRFPVM